MKKLNVYILFVLIGLVVLIVMVTENPVSERILKREPSGVIGDGYANLPAGSFSEIDEELAKVIDELSLEEKVGQLVIAGFPGVRMTDAMEDLIREYKVGGFIFFAHNLEHPEQSLQLLNDVKEVNSENKFPLLLSVDQEGGRVTRLPGIRSLPTNEQIAKREEDDFGYRYGELLAEQLNAFGLQLNFAPSVDVNSNVENRVIGNRSFGSDPELVADLGVQVLKGMADNGVIASVKHFPGHGDTQIDSHVDMPIVEKTLEELNEVELIPFRKAIEQGVDVVMTAHILLPYFDGELPATLSGEIVTDLLRKDLGFDGVVITDDMTMGAISQKYGLEEAAVKAVQAGIDIVLVAHGAEEVIAVIEQIVQAVRQGDIPVERIDESVARIIRLKEKYKLVDTANEAFDIDYLNEQISELMQ